ncbi:uncharacterized protein LOC133034424 [Cannabis sativa]|uniref:uncharacterized protein LOC133034424 n=1 Tax=Cannabis sativa TaxID=3483 RepID=UPI0029CA38E8|nr:uncharacterized protein LOC133034424 [Cannabis sativa]
MGDFNSFLSYDDKEGSTYYDIRDMDTFSNFLPKFHLSPLPFVGNKFTWRNNFVREHLDWAISSDSWSDLFPDDVLHHLPFFGSDHRALKLILKDDSFNFLSRRSRRFLFENHEIARIQGIPFSNQDNRFRLQCLQSQLDALLYKEEIYWRQRSRTHWLKAGDKNTKFFHRFASKRKKNNTIKFLKDDNQNIVSDHNAMGNLVVSYFSDLFGSHGSDADVVNLILDCLGPPLDDSDSAFLDAPFSTKEAVLSCLNEGIDFFAVNTTLISLIPKKQHAHTLKDFRPVSLCSTFYKVISKVLANRLKAVLDKIISPYQRAFVSGLVIFDNILIAQEIGHAINSRKSGKLGWAALKLDMAKAFDRVDWHYLESIMFHFNFPPRFVSLIMKCIATTSLSFLINGSVCGSLQPSRGLRQGDPLSPYLFILCAEGISALLRAKQDIGLLKGIAISRTAPSLSHLFFADDSLIFCTANRVYCLALQDAFDVYSKASGQDRVISVLRGWSVKCFSRAGKEVLLKAVIQAIPAYAMACFRFPVKLCKGIKAVMARFWWCSVGNSHKIHWKSWKSLCKSKFIGGLGFRSLVHFNQAMLGKQAWRIFKNPSSLLAQVLQARHFPRSSFLQANSGHNPSFTWRSILWGRELLNSGLLWKIGNGSDIRTIEDHWLPSNSCFSPHLVDENLSVLVLGEFGKDDIIWGHHSSGEFTVKSAYHLAFSSQDIASSSSFFSSKKFWSKIWNSKIPPKVKVQVLPCASNLDQTTLQQLPSEGAFHIFTDAVVDLNRQKYSIGAVVLNHSGQVVAGLAKPFSGCVSPMVAEAKAVVHALQWAYSIFLPVDVLKTDCKSIVDRFYSCTQGCSSIDDLIVCIKNLLSLRPSLRLAHVNREFNTIAHRVAKWGIGIDSKFLWNGSLPSF